MSKSISFVDSIEDHLFDRLGDVLEFTDADRRTALENAHDAGTLLAVSLQQVPSELQQMACIVLYQEFSRLCRSLALQANRFDQLTK